MRFKICILLFISIAVISCQVVKPYQRVYLNDPEMQMGKDITGKFEDKTEDIREGAKPPASTNSTAGCGCN